ncbi:MAG: hypothetical protein H6658_17735 [Ardenticatenaceae bacterium]|nr:hypothetical protein [Ardenticatenaceae bacterium]
MSQKDFSDPGNWKTKSAAEKLKEQLIREKGKRFRRFDFQPIDSEGLIFERNFHETGETVQVTLTKNKKIATVYLSRRQ